MKAKVIGLILVAAAAGGAWYYTGSVDELGSVETGRPDHDQSPTVAPAPAPANADGHGTGVGTTTMPPSPEPARPETLAGARIDEITLAGIFRTRDGFVAQFRAKRYQKSFLAKQGDRLLDGEVSELGERSVTLRRDPAAEGGAAQGDVVLTL